MSEWTNRGKFNGISSRDLMPKKGDAVWDPSRRIPDKFWGPNSNGVVHAIFYEDKEVLVKWYDSPKDKFVVMNFEDFSGRWTDKYGGGYWLDDSTTPSR